MNAIYVAKESMLDTLANSVKSIPKTSINHEARQERLTKVRETINNAYSDQQITIFERRVLLEIVDEHSRD